LLKPSVTLGFNIDESGGKLGFQMSKDSETGCLVKSTWVSECVCNVGNTRQRIEKLLTYWNAVTETKRRLEAEFLETL
jgi:hypothetical protein